MKRFKKYYETIFSASMAVFCLIEAIFINENPTAETLNMVFAVGFSAIAVGFYFRERGRE